MATSGKIGEWKENVVRKQTDNYCKLKTANMIVKVFLKTIEMV